jgi:drug/metabolite transporter (DMT)-like permease
LRGRELLLLLALAALWSASFLLIKVAVAEVTPTFVVLARLVFGSLMLLLAIPFLRTRLPELLPPKDGRGVRESLVSLRWPLFLLGTVNAVVPYTAIAWGEKFIASGMASIFNATVPLFTAFLVLTLPFFPEERPGLLGLAGLLFGFAGVGLLVTGEPGDGSGSTQTAQLLGGGAVLLGSLSYAVGNVFARRHLEGAPILIPAVGQNLAGVLVVLPFALAFGLPEKLPSAGTVAALFGLGVGGTGVAYLLYFGLIARVGPTKTSTVAYLIPVVAIFYGAVFLDEAFTLRALVGLALILGGVAGVTGALRLRKKLRREPPVP